tara:strand:+ start:2193 stop:3434 length:1242 start_codon:yes stop_codon:yes gene_type:complete
MASFNPANSPTPFGIYDNDDHFSSDADKMVVYVKRKLGDDLLSVELTSKQIWANFEEAVLKYSKIVNQHQAESYMSNLMGISTGSLTGSDGSKIGPHGKEQQFPRETLEYLTRRAEPYAEQAGIGGAYNTISGSIKLEQGRQDYDIYTELKTLNSSGNEVAVMSNDYIDESNTTRLKHAAKGKLRIYEVFHFSPQAAYRFFDTTSAINYLNNQFAFESFTPETVFYVLPVFEDVLRAGQLDISNRIRRSNFSYKIQGTKIRIYPNPTQDNPLNLFLRVGFPADPFRPAFEDESIFGVSNLSNIPFGNIPYKGTNSIARQWIREYTLALSKETLGLVRSKFSSVPIPGADLQLNGSELISQGREDQDKLKTSLGEQLDRLTYQKLLETDAAQSEQMQNILKRIPVPNGQAIIIG